MVAKKLLALMALLLVTTLVVTACGSKASTTSTTDTTSAPFPQITIKTNTPPASTSATPSVTTPTSTKVTATTPPAPVALRVITGDVTGISLTGAMLNGTINGGTGVDTVGFQWGTSQGKYDFSYENKGQFSTGSFERLVTNLKGGTVYYYRAMAHDNTGFVYGQEKTFRTMGVPKITSLSATKGLVGQDLQITINGSDFTAASGVNFGDGIYVSSFTVTGDTQIVVNISIQSDAATGLRSVTVTTPYTEGTLANSFMVQEKKLVSHMVYWTDTQFNQLMYSMTASNTGYTFQFHDGMEVTMVADKAVPLWVKLQDGKLIFENLAQTYWDNIFSAAAQYLSYDSATKTMTFNAFPASFLLTLFDVPKTVLPEFDRVATGEGRLSVYYTSLDTVP